MSQPKCVIWKGSNQPDFVGDCDGYAVRGYCVHTDGGRGHWLVVIGCNHWAAVAESFDEAMAAAVALYAQDELSTV